MEYAFTQYPYDEQTVTKIIDIINKNSQSKRIILQFPKKYLAQAFHLTKHLRKIFSLQENKQQSQKRQFYTLFDSMKKQCCTDIIGAEHINYDLLIHFGQACFSEQIKSNHYYLFPTLETNLIEHFRNSFTNDQFVQDLKSNKIKYLLTEQKMYEYVKNILSETLQKANVQLLRLPYDKKQDDQYLIFGYYANKNKTLLDKQNSFNNILTLFFSHPQSDNKLLSDIHLTMGSFSSNKNLFSAVPDIFVSSLEVPTIQKSTFNYAKPLMARLSQIGELQKHQVFGLLVSNVGTKFSQQAVQNCKKILQKHHKKYYVFMMNNLNEVKLGNFPQIEVYVIISCFNNSCFSMKDFYRLVVTPMDLQVAFDDVSIGEYNFDLSHPKHLIHPYQLQNSQNQQNIQQKDKNTKLKQQQNQALSIQQKQQIILASTLQTLDYYRNKQYKGLDFSQKKPIEKIKKGKIGLAEHYQPLPNNQTQF